MDRRSRFEYGSSTLECSISTQPWLPIQETIGGSKVAASGVPASYVVREDGLVDVTLRVLESEWVALLALISYGQTAQAFSWFPDTDEATEFSVYLVAPEVGQRFAPARDPSYPRVLLATITLRNAGGGPEPWTPYFT